MVRTTTAVVIIIVIPLEKTGQLTASKLCSKLDSIDEDDRETTFFPSTIDIHSPFCFFSFPGGPHYTAEFAVLHTYKGSPLELSPDR